MVERIWLLLLLLLLLLLPLLLPLSPSLCLDPVVASDAAARNRCAFLHSHKQNRTRV